MMLSQAPDLLSTLYFYKSEVLLEHDLSCFANIEFYAVVSCLFQMIYFSGCNEILGIPICSLCAQG